MRDRANVAILFSRYRAGPERTASRVRPVLLLKHQADRQRHRAGTKYLLWHRAGARGKILCYNSQTGGAVFAWNCRSAGGSSDPRISVGYLSSAGSEAPLKSSPGVVRSSSHRPTAATAFEIVLESFLSASLEPRIYA